MRIAIGGLSHETNTFCAAPTEVDEFKDREWTHGEALVARHEVATLRLAIPQEIRSALDAYRVARDRVRRFEEAFLREARDARAAAEVSYRAGASSLLEFLEAERAYVETQRDHLDALHDAQVAAWALMRSAALEGAP